MFKLASSALSRYCKGYAKVDVKSLMCSLEDNYCTSTSADQAKPPALITSTSSPTCEDPCDNHDSLETDVIIESMAEEVPLIAILVEENVSTQHTMEVTEIMMASKDHQEAKKKSPAAAVDVETTEDYIVHYDALGENVTFLKRNTRTCNIEKQISVIWMKDAKECKWSIPLKQLSKSDIYELSNPVPNWSEMDPYSGIEDVHDESESDIPAVPLEENSTVNPINQELLYTENSNTAVPDLTVQQKPTSSRYSLCNRQYKNCGNETLRSSGRTKHASVNYAETTDDNDSDYEPCANHVKHTNPGLREPTRSHLES